MIIKFSNLGSIKETELDLRPLTVIIGPNNSNKTYIAYSVYGLRSYLRNIHFVPELLNKEAENKFALRIDDLLFNSIHQFIERRLRAFERGLEEFFQDTSGRLFVNTSFSMTLSNEEMIQGFEHLVGPQTLELDRDYALAYSLSSNKDAFYIQFDEQFDENMLMRRGVIQEAFFSFSSKLFSECFSRAVLFPAERNAFIVTYKILAHRRYNLLRQLQRGSIDPISPERERQLDLLREQGDLRYPQPIEDFLDFLTNIELQQNSIDQEIQAPFQEVADAIEIHIQNKNRTILRSTRLQGKEIKVNVKRGLSIDLYNASSSIKQLAPLLLYLRYRAAENDLLIIDEPEMGLHPESQAKLLEALAILVNLGVKVLLTTHSPYFIAHLNNLLNGEMGDSRILKKQASHLYMNDARAFLHEDQVSAYEMQDHKGKGYKLCSLKDDFENFGVKWGSLSDVSADLQQKFFEISEEKETVPHG